MDAATQHTRQDHCRSAFVRVGAVLSFIGATMYSAQSQQLEIQSVDGNQTIVHDMISDVQAFPEVQWAVHNSLAINGIAVIWTADAFSNSGGSSSRLADTGLTLRIQGALPDGQWQVTQATDETDITNNDNSASVALVCPEEGEATLGILVTFKTAPNSVPAAGQYQMHLVGTITAL